MTALCWVIFAGAGLFGSAVAGIGIGQTLRRAGEIADAAGRADPRTYRTLPR